jgi:hypothetical protein
VPKSDLIRFDRSLVQFDFVVVADVFRVSARVPAGGGIQVFCNEGGSLRTPVWLKFFICCLAQIFIQSLTCIVSHLARGGLHEQVRLVRLFGSSSSFVAWLEYSFNP